MELIFFFPIIVKNAHRKNTATILLLTANSNRNAQWRYFLFCFRVSAHVGFKHFLNIPRGGKPLTLMCVSCLARRD